MAAIRFVRGVKTVIANIRKENARAAKGVEKGLKKSGLLLQRASQKMVPVHHGPLKASAFTRATGKGWKTKVYVGYTAEYALFVHESVGMVLKGQKRTGKFAKGRYWDPQGKAQAKFLEAPLRRLHGKIRKVIQESARV